MQVSIENLHFSFSIIVYNYFYLERRRSVGDGQRSDEYHTVRGGLVECDVAQNTLRKILLGNQIGEITLSKVA